MPNPKPPSPEREQTDESLRAERAATDSALSDEQLADDDVADAVIVRARERADALVAAARAKVDGSATDSTTLAAVPRALRRQRALEDLELREEREDADTTVRAERADHAEALAVGRDETDKDLLKERMLADIELARRDEFLAIVSHDLRSMLSSIVLSAALIGEDSARGQNPDYAAKHAKRIQSSSARMSRLIGDLVDVASIEAGALAVTCEPCDLAQVVEEALDTFQVQAAAKNISLSVATSAQLPEASFDAARILQVLVNLLSNALKFTPAGGKVGVRLEHNTTELLCAVDDTGSGIPADKLEAIFERFLQLTRNDRRGLGLGLYISKCIIQGHGGRIWAERSIDQGSTFCFTLPLAGTPT